ncbi:hypothetical protein A7M79_07415 [Acinetobacter baumannii]|uniref:hypothetical protein n=1 Tax=Acinetobacter baumannii TaxID=470 RepID=UPI0008DE312D|nr:hypothetical protein [Acinetobacter baumannii]OIH08635.1 hypothetical protein A7M79_07415 [Acinetobacter baumannii]
MEGLDKGLKFNPVSGIIKGVLICLILLGVLVFITDKQVHPVFKGALYGLCLFNVGSLFVSIFKWLMVGKEKTNRIAAFEAFKKIQKDREK